MSRASSALDSLAKGHSGMILGADCDEQYRSAGFWLMDVVEKATKSQDSNESSDNPFRDFNKIASTYYEKKESRGWLHIAPREHRAFERTVEFTMPVRLGNHRSIRKLLELSTGGLALLADSACVYGVGRLKRRPAKPAPDLFSIMFDGHGRWTLSHAENDLMIVEHGLPRLPRPSLERAAFEKKANDALGAVTQSDLAAMWLIIDTAIGQKHGTTLVFHKNAAAEATRLSKQATPVKPLLLSPPLVKALSAIDGAIISDTDGTCHAIGVILDGIATERGSAARGSRYNSSIRYTDLCKRQGQECLVVVISDDGSIDMIS